MQTSKLIRISKALERLFKTVQKIIVGCMIAVAAVLAVLTIVNAVNPEAVIASDIQSIDIGPITAELEQEYAPDNKTILIYAWIVTVMAAVCACVICWALQLIRKILTPMAEGKPFSQSIGKDFRKLSFASLAVGVVCNVITAVETAGTLYCLEYFDLFANSPIQSVTVDFHFDLTFLIVFFVLLLMAHVFDYGAELQKLSDETL